MINAWVELWRYYTAEGFQPGLDWLAEHGFRC
jgi:hypothetical protein